MSLAILSSQQNYNEKEQPQQVEAPNHFQNYFSKPITLPANAEVAVVNAKINRSQNFSIGPDTDFKVYLGDELSETFPLKYSTSTPMTIGLSDADLKSLSYEEARQRIQDRLNADVLHPDMLGRSSVSLQQDATSKEITGFTFQFNKAKDGVSNSQQVSAFWEPFSDESTDGFTVATQGTYGKRITRGTLEEPPEVPACIAVGIDTPLTPNGGIFHFQPSNGIANNTVWACGLARPLQISNNDNDYDASTIEEVYPDWFQRNFEFPFNGYYDWVVARESDGNIHVYQTGHNGLDDQATDGHIWSLHEIEYWNASSDNSYYHEEEGPVVSTTFSSFRFEVQNELMIIQGFDGSSWRDIINPVSTSVAFNQITRPVGQNEWALYPVIELVEDGDHLDAVEFNGAYKPGDVKINYYTETWYARQYDIYDKSARPSLTQALDNRPWNNSIRDPHFHTWKGLLNSGTHRVVDKNVVMIVAEEQLYTPRRIYPYANMDLRDLLGFNVAIVNQNDFGTLDDHDSEISFSSTVKPQAGSIREIFIKLDSLTIESFNGAMSDISKIIYSIPRFDNSGGVVGPLFFENNDRYYLKLNNPSPIQLNRIDCSLVSVNNRLVDGLYGNTVITLHFRQSQN